MAAKIAEAGEADNLGSVGNIVMPRSHVDSTSLTIEKQVTKDQKTQFLGPQRVSFAFFLNLPLNIGILPDSNYKPFCFWLYTISLTSTSEPQS